MGMSLEVSFRQRLCLAFLLIPGCFVQLLGDINVGMGWAVPKLWWVRSELGCSRSIPPSCGSPFRR